jgi:L-fuculose-phosphate aldolase
MSLADLVACDAKGNVIEGKGAPTSEFSMHQAAYRARPDVHAVIHAHPPTATAFAAASVALDGLMLPEMVVYLGPVALVPYATPGTEDLAERLRPYLADHNAFLLENHGALTLGKDIQQAALRMELVEQNAIVSFHVKQLGRPFQLEAEDLEALDRLRQRLASM